MRLVIDLQASQTPSSGRRGIGRYSLMLARAVAELRADDDVRIVLSDVWPEMRDEVVSAFDGLLPRESFSAFDSAGPAFSRSDDACARLARSSLFRHHVASLSPDALHVSSMFEGLDPDAITPFEIDRLAPTVVGSTMYDLIPMIYAGHYMANPSRPYLESVYREYSKHDVILAISEATRLDAIRLLGIDQDRIVNIAGDVDPIFRRIAQADERAETLLPRYGIDRPFVLYTGGYDYRKNVEGLIRSFALMDTRLRESHKLVIVCRLLDSERDTLMTLADQHGIASSLILTGYVPDEDLVLLKNLCRLFVFPSLYEGFGLPVLEAMRCGAPVIGSATSSIPEIIGRGDALFDPGDDSSIARAMERTLGDPGHLDSLRRHGIERARAFSWSNSAGVAWQAYREAHERRRWQQGAGGTRRVIMRSPMPPSRSGIATHAEELAEVLREHCDLVVYSDEPSPLDPSVRPASELVPGESDPSGIVWQFGNSEFHTGMWDPIIRDGGIVVLHDFFLEGVISYMEATENRVGFRDSNIAYSHPDPDDGLADLYGYLPMNRALIDAADGLVVHSRFALSLFAEFYPDLVGTRVLQVPLIRKSEPAVTAEERARLRASFDLPVDGFVVISLGFVHKVKYAGELIDAIAELIDVVPEATFVFVGEAVEDLSDEARSVIESCPERIRITGFLDDEAYRNMARCADLGIQLRRETRGETSRAVLDCMACGVPVIVNDIGAFREIPEDCAYRLPAVLAPEDISRAVLELHRDPGRRATMAANARARIESEHSPDHVCTLLLAYLRRFEADVRQKGIRHRLDELAGLISPIRHEVDEVALTRSVLANAAPALPPSKRQRAIDALDAALNEVRAAG